MSLKSLRSLFMLLMVVLFSHTARATLFWQSDTNRGTSIFEGLEKAPGTIVLTNDPLNRYGVVYNYNTWDDTNYAKERCESRGNVTPSGNFRMAYTNDYYIGWREMWNPMPINGSWVALFQMHGYGVSGQGAPLVLRCVNGDGNLYLQNGANGVDTNFWHTPFITSVWHTFVLHVFLSTNVTEGYTEVWYDGARQTFNNGQTRWYGPTWDNVDGVWQDSYNLLKWGVYRSGTLNGKGPASTFMTSAKIGSTFADVDPNGGGDFSMAVVPASQTVAPGRGTNYTVTISAINGFSTNVSLSVSGLPSGASPIFSPATVTNSGSATMTVSTSVSTPIGNYLISVIGSSGTLAHTNTVTLVVSGFTLSSTPAAQTVNAGASTNFTIMVTTNGSFSGNVAFGLSGLPAGASGSFSPSSLDQSGSATLTVQTTTNTAAGNYPLTIFATNGSLVATTSVALVVVGLQANAGTLVWTNGAGNLNWSSPLNWTNITGGAYGPPGSSNSVVFTNWGTVANSALTSPGSGVVVPANLNTIANGSFAIINLTNLANAPNTSPNFQNVQIASGATLTAGGIQIGGFGVYDFGANNVVNTTISGAGATLLVTNGGVNVSQGSGSSGAHTATLDLSGLDNFILTGTQLRLGVENITRAGGVVYLARTNSLTLSTAGYINTDGSGSPYSGNPALYLGHNKTAVGNGAQLYLGIANTIAADYVTIGRGDANDLMKFNPAFLAQSPSVTIQGTNGPGSRVGVYLVGDNSPGEGSSVLNTNDFSGGTVNALINYLCVGRGREGANDTTTCSAFLTFTVGSIDANTLAIGFLYPNGSNSFANGTVNVNSGTLLVNSNLILASRPNTGGSGSTSGTLNVNGGTVQVTNVSGGGGTSTVNLNSGTMDLQPAWATWPGLITGLSVLNVGANGTSQPALLTDAAQISTFNNLNIAANGMIAGDTSFNTPNLVVQGALSPGSGGAGAMTNSGSVTFGPGGQFIVTVDDAAAGPVLGWSFLQATGSITIQSTPANPFNLVVQTVDNPAANFDSNSNYDWVIASAGSGITGFVAANFTINAGLFQNDLGLGSFYLHTTGNSLVLSFTNNLPPPPPMVTSVLANGSGFSFSGINGVSNGTYYVLATTNLLLPQRQWPRVATNSFDANGSFSFTNPINSPQRFFRLQLQ